MDAFDAEKKPANMPALSLAPGNSSEDQQRFRPRGDGVGEWSVRRLMGEIFLAGEKSQKWPALFRAVVADGAAQHGIARFERVQHRALGYLALDLELDLAANLRQGSQMWR
jgi:hypothetical protein